MGGGGQRGPRWVWGRKPPDPGAGWRAVDGAPWVPSAASLQQSPNVQKPKAVWAAVSARAARSLPVRQRAQAVLPTVGTRGPRHKQCPRASREAGHQGTPGPRRLREAPLLTSKIMGARPSGGLGVCTADFAGGPALRY